MKNFLNVKSIREYTKTKLHNVNCVSFSKNSRENYETNTSLYQFVIMQDLKTRGCLSGKEVSVLVSHSKGQLFKSDQRCPNHP